MDNTNKREHTRDTYKRRPWTPARDAKADNNKRRNSGHKKASDYIPHDLLITKLFAYRFNGNVLKYIYTYLKNRKQCVRLNNVST